MNRHSQKGSALLIVLGFLSFMVVSAVAFAIWMRNERLPSSALRRNVANRYLVKAALAQAMSRVDDAIRSHPYPGAWSTNDTEYGTRNVSAYRDKNGLAYDWWESRVFMPPDPEGVRQKDGSNIDYPRYAPVTKTVSVLSLEALGYLPPSIVNDVRLLSRSSWTAQWEYFNFDAGRYAFCAVNVSDMLDINKIAADSPRTSAAAARPESSGKAPPPSRFSLAHLFRSSGNGFANPSGHDAFDTLTHKGLPDWPGAPLVSLMDYNLALEDKTVGALFSPFYFLLSGRSTSGGFYGGGQGSLGVNGAARQPFVTDSWFPRSEYELSLNFCDIAQYQPFRPGVKRTANEVDMGLEPNFWRKIREEGHALCAQDTYMLYDYLDEDNLPLSLAMPCVERVPMVTALGPVRPDLQVEFQESADPEVKDVSETERWKIYDVKVKVTTPQISSGLVFPFVKGSGEDNRSYEVQAFMQLVFVDEGENADPDKPIVPLRSDGFPDLRPKKIADWKEAGDKQFRFPVGEGDPNSLVVTSFGTDTWQPNVEEPRDVYKNDGWKRLGGSEPREETILKRIEVYKVTKTEANPQGTEEKTGERYQVVLRPLKSDGKSLVEISTDPMEEAEFTALCGKIKMRPYLMTWIRVKDGNDTVDLVPAVFDDDNELNGVDFASGRVRNLNPFGYSDDEDSSHPFLHFPSKMLLTYADVKEKKVSTSTEWKYRACYTVDPRFNWAPENWWYEKDEPSLLKWYNRVFDTGGILDDLAKDEFPEVAGTDNPRGDRARDPILFVSNLGYLQSVGELAFLPRLSVMNNLSYPDCVLNAGAYDGTIRDRDENQDCVKTMPCARAAWKSYQNYRTNADPSAFEFGANLYRRGLVNPQQGFYVNPFTQNKEVMLAAFANTPLNYWVAGTNYQAQGKSQTTKFRSQDVFDADTSFHADYLAEYMMHRYEDLANMLKIKTGNMTAVQSYMFQRLWADMFDALDWGGRMNTQKKVEDVYRELATYYKGETYQRRGGDPLEYSTMYVGGNDYGVLNHFVTQKNYPLIEDLDLTRAIHADEYADPLYYYNGRNAPSRTPTTGDYICDADRMFLHSYWRDCFASRQQLFLIFVRAESTALGGTGEGTPAQQGGRAVALVWRDPEAPTGDDVYEVEGNQDWDNRDSMRHPHKMRVLFYRQLD